MKIISQSPDQLVLKETFTALYVIGGVMVALGLLITFSDPSSNWIPGLLILFFGAVVFALGGYRTLTVNKSSATLTEYSHTLIRKRTTPYRISNALYISENYRGNNPNNHQRNKPNQSSTPYYEYRVHFNDNQSLVVGKAKVSALGQLKSIVSGAQSTIPDYVQTLADYLGISVKQGGADQVLATVGTLGGIFKQ